MDIGSRSGWYLVCHTQVQEYNYTLALSLAHVKWSSYAWPHDQNQNQLRREMWMKRELARFRLVVVAIFK